MLQLFSLPDFVIIGLISNWLKIWEKIKKSLCVSGRTQRDYLWFVKKKSYDNSFIILTRWIMYSNTYNWYLKNSHYTNSPIKQEIKIKRAEDRLEWCQGQEWPPDNCVIDKERNRVHLESIKKHHCVDAWLSYQC